MKSVPTITLKEALEIMERKQPVNIVFRTANLSKKTGGERKELKGVILHSSDWANSIRTFQDPQAKSDSDLIDVHIRLMLYLNGRRIIY